MDFKVIGVVGAGRMGLTLARLMKPAGFEFVFHDIRREALERASAAGYAVAESLEDLVGRVDAVMVAVSHDAMKPVISYLADLLARPEAKARLVFDISTFKEGVVEAYESVPSKVLAASVHPLFGPGARDPRVHTVAVMPVPGHGEEGAKAAAGIFEKAGFKVIHTTVSEHEESVAYTIGLSYVIATAFSLTVKERWKRSPRIYGITFRILKSLASTVATDPVDFVEYVLSNPRVRRAAVSLVHAVASILDDPKAAAPAARELTAGEEDKLYRTLYKCLEGVPEDGGEGVTSAS
ncbi:prephenate dehydrogenase [Stetteria hydrogenophila]